jgi:hypothetical protein
MNSVLFYWYEGRAKAHRNILSETYNFRVIFLLKTIESICLEMPKSTYCHG